jgi:hypothetical protein
MRQRVHQVVDAQLVGFVRLLHRHEA